MAIGITGVDVTLDETAGLQNATATPSPAGDADDNDILVASLPSDFSTRLTALSAGTATGAALSGYTGAVGNTGSNAFTVTGGASITDISFVDSAGAPLDGADSGLFTLDGTSILLYTDTNNNNILLGRAGSATGAIVFAAYIEETGSPVSGGKIWTVEYQPLQHPDDTNPDDSLNLLDKVFVGTSQDLEFSLAGVPSGANLFLMFTKTNPTVVDDSGVLRITDPTIIATGKDPADESSGANINTGDTIITSQAANPTTFGTNSQMITEQDGIRFSFVTGARQDVTIPNLSPTEADVESNIDFTAVFNAKMASFEVVQLQSGKSAVVKISAFTTAAEPGVNFINGYANDTPVAITNVRVFNSAGVVIENSNGSVNDPAIGITFSGGVATITGVLAGYQIEYTTASDHNRVLVENGAALDARGNTHADFDIGGFTLLQTAVSTAEIGSKMLFEDDGPALAFGNLIGSGSVLPQTGYWSHSAGADGLDADGLDISVNSSFTLVRPDNTTTTGTATLTEQSPSPDGNGTYQFVGTLTGDFDNNAATTDTTIDYTLSALADGSYVLDLVQGFSSTVVLSSADGALGAGGPDPVRTLLIPEQDPPTIPSPSEEIVFFGVNATTSSSDIFSAIGLGAPDLTEAQIESGGFAFIGAANMNVSTSGIGIGNNNLDGNTVPGINGADPNDSKSVGDESFVINPESLLSSMKVFIDNSVQGYNPATEELYYTIFYADGTTSGSPTKVLAADLTAEAGGQTSFVIEKADATLIDAVQLTMGLGTIKIPVIQFIQETESLASDIQLTFNATVTDGDGDSATSTFDANLFANDLTGSFDYTLVGTGGEQDAFNVDLSFTENLYQVTGFDAGADLRDTLVLNGDQNAVVQIDNTGADSIVSVTETGGQVTTITLVGVDLLSSDIVYGSV
ncbi:beta strand repeat-containing protein [Pseudomonas frederiksbergensis]|uniref:beta strand repeat-containing protein n=1 Tax=Pseudomonas frederiksbergensis TaxID=104087 RepID=UPI003D1FF362